MVSLIMIMSSMHVNHTADLTTIAIYVLRQYPCITTYLICEDDIITMDLQKLVIVVHV